MLDLKLLQKACSNWKPPRDETPADNLRDAEKKSTVEEKPRRKIEPPPNCYVDGVIASNFGKFSYAQIYRYTSQPLEIKDDGAELLPSDKCITRIEYERGYISKAQKNLVCGKNCRYCRNCADNYLEWCSTLALYSETRKSLYQKGLARFIDFLGLGFDPIKKVLTFPLNNYQYVELGFDGREFTQPKKESSAVLMHYNRDLVIDGAGGFKVDETAGCGLIEMPYLDNRFYGIDGEVVIATNSCKGAVLPFAV